SGGDGGVGVALRVRGCLLDRDVPGDAGPGLGGGARAGEEALGAPGGAVGDLRVVVHAPGHQSHVVCGAVDAPALHGVRGGGPVLAGEPVEAAAGVGVEREFNGVDPVVERGAGGVGGVRGEPVDAPVG